MFERKKAHLKKSIAAALLLTASAFSFSSFQATSVNAQIKQRQQQQSTQLFSFDDVQTNDARSSDNGRTSSIAAIRERRIKLQATATKLEKSKELEFPLLNELSYKVERNKNNGFERRATEDVTWRGRIVEDPSSSVTLTMKNGVMSGSIFSSTGVYEIVPQQDGRQLLVEINQDLLSSCGTSHNPVAEEHLHFANNSFMNEAAVEEKDQPAENLGSNDQLSTLATSSAVTTAATTTSTGLVVDVMVLYTDDARNAAGGTANIQSTIQQAIDVTNTAYANSGVAHRVRLVHTAELNYDETGKGQTDLINYGGLSSVKALRNQHKADLVSLFVETSDVGGVAWIMRNFSMGYGDSAYSVVKRSAAISILALAHEMGHNMGLEHNVENASNSPIYPYSYGHYINGQFRTVMSCANPCTSGCPVSPYFSNPNVSYKGYATGIANQREEARSLNNTAMTVTSFRAVAPAAPQSGSFYQLQARHTGKCLDVPSASTANGARLQQYSCHTGYNQQFKLESTGDGYYRLIARHSNKVVDVAGDSMADGGYVHQWDNFNKPNQQWKLDAVGEGYYKLTARHSSKALEVSGISMDNRASIQQLTYKSQSNQNWLLRLVQ